MSWVGGALPHLSLEPSELLPSPAPSPPFASPTARPVTIEVFGRTAVVALPGDLDQQPDGELARSIDYAIRCGHQHLVLDFTQATFLDCRSFRILLRAVARLDHPNSAVVLAGAQGVVLRTLDVLQGDLLFTTFPSRADALRALRDPSREMNEGWRTLGPPELLAPRELMPEAGFATWDMGTRPSLV